MKSNRKEEPGYISGSFQKTLFLFQTEQQYGGDRKHYF